MFCLLLKKNRRLNSSDVNNECILIEENLNDDIDSIFIDLCEKLSCLNNYVFVFQMNEKDFGLDIGTDLSVFMEQYDDFEKFILNDDVKSFSIEFYEKDIDEIVYFERKSKDRVLILNRESIKTFINITDLKEMLTVFIKGFVSDIRYLYPNIYSNDIFKNWLSSLKLLSDSDY